MPWKTNIPTGGAITINGAKLTFDRSTRVTVHDNAHIMVTKPDGSFVGWDLSDEKPQQNEGVCRND